MLLYLAIRLVTCGGSGCSGSGRGSSSGVRSEMPRNSNQFVHLYTIGIINTIITTCTF